MRDDEENVIMYDQVYTPNPEVCPGMHFLSFKDMMDSVGSKLEHAASMAEIRKEKFLPYTAECVIKPEFA
jgi:hypothetical protein